VNGFFSHGLKGFWDHVGLNDMYDLTINKPCWTREMKFLQKGMNPNLGSNHTTSGAVCSPKDFISVFKILR
jgi:hypothetical protein